MSAKKSLPDFSTHPKRIIESAGGEYAGIQQTHRGELHVFRDPLTGTSLAIYDSELTAGRVAAHMAESRFVFSCGSGEVRP